MWRPRFEIRTASPRAARVSSPTVKPAWAPIAASTRGRSAAARPIGVDFAGEAQVLAYPGARALHAVAVGRLVAEEAAYADLLVGLAYDRKTPVDGLGPGMVVHDARHPRHGRVRAAGEGARFEDGQVDGTVEPPPQMSELLGEVLRGRDVDHESPGQRRVQVGVGADESGAQVGARDSFRPGVLPGQPRARLEDRTGRAPRGWAGDEDVHRFRDGRRLEGDDAHALEQCHEEAPSR